MPLGASVLRCSWSSRWGHLSQVGTVFFLSPRSYRRLSLLLVGLVPGLGRVPLPQAGTVFFGHALVLVAISPMYSFGMWSPFGSIVSFCPSWSRTKVYIVGCFFSDIATHIGVEVVFIRPLSVCRNFWWLVATLFPGLSLFFTSGLSSPGLLGCLALCLRYADLLYLWLCAHGLLDQGIRGLFACPSPSSLLWFCKFRWVLFSPMVHTLRNGVTPAGSRLLSSIGTKV